MPKYVETKWKEIQIKSINRIANTHNHETKATTE